MGLLQQRCQPAKSPESTLEAASGSLEHAVRFELSEGQIEVIEPWPGAENKLYEISEAPTSIVCTSTTMLPYLEMLGVEHTLVGFPNLDFISSEAIRSLIDQGHISDLGSDATLNVELLVGLNPDLLIAFDAGTNGAQLSQIQEAGIPIVLCADYLESTALGRAEWIKFFGAIFDKRARADSLFANIQNRYDSLRAMTQNVTSRPTILSGVVYGDVWFLPGGENWSSRLFSDAGGTYLWDDNDNGNWLELSFESVFERANEASYWIGTASYDSKQMLEEGDERYTLFAPYAKDQIYNYDKRISATGGNDYFESGYARPDLVLADLIKILHPELLPTHELYYYRRLP